MIGNTTVDCGDGGIRQRLRSRTRRGLAKGQYLVERTGPWHEVEQRPVAGNGGAILKDENS
jgi:hypothetical protein